MESLGLGHRSVIVSRMRHSLCSGSAQRVGCLRHQRQCVVVRGAAGIRVLLYCALHNAREGITPMSMNRGNRLAKAFAFAAASGCVREPPLLILVPPPATPLDVLGPIATGFPLAVAASATVAPAHGPWFRGSPRDL
jgi:hypothetical protein